MIYNSQKQRQLLIAFDKERDYYPLNFDRDAALKQLAQLKLEIERRFDVTCDENDPNYIQDSCYHGELILPSKMTHATWRPRIRTCNFGNMVAIANESTLIDGSLSKLVKIFEQTGYQYISEDLLRQPYDGEDGGIGTWWERYFDFL